MRLTCPPLMTTARVRTGPSWRRTGPEQPHPRLIRGLTPHPRERGRTRSEWDHRRECSWMLAQPRLRGQCSLQNTHTKKSPCRSHGCETLAGSASPTVRGTSRRPSTTGQGQGRSSRREKHGCARIGQNPQNRTPRRVSACELDFRQCPWCVCAWLAATRTFEQRSRPRRTSPQPVSSAREGSHPPPGSRRGKGPEQMGTGRPDTPAALAGGAARRNVRTESISCRKLQKRSKALRNNKALSP